MTYKSVNAEEQIKILKNRNMIFKDEEKALETLKHISYYKIKEFAEPFSKRQDRTGKPPKLDYGQVTFEVIISRYYQDKNFRMYMLHAIEDIEVALQTQIGFVLGEATGDYGYLDFKNWADISGNDKDQITEQENILKRTLQKQIVKSNTRELTEKLAYGNNNKYPPVWLAMNQLMFGQLIQLLKIMSRRNLKKIAAYFDCANDELISWMQCISLVRNKSAHNSNLIDLKLKTPPIIRKEWRKYLYSFKKDVYTNRVSVPIIILKYLMDEINPKYDYRNISTAVKNLIQDSQNTANYFGFESVETITEIFPKKRRKLK